MLSDKARIFVQAGRGGDGCMSFRREAHVPRGGPDGGDGGHGAAVVLVCDDSLRDLQSFKRRAHYKAPRGRHGEGSQRHGADGEDLIVRVPPGTVATLEDGTVHDLVVPGQRAVVAQGGSGGRGNKRFSSATRQAPRFAEKGLEGGEGSQRHGADGEDLIVRVPPGTVAQLEDGTVHDLVVPGQRAVVAQGGSGGRGNRRFSSATRQAPRFAEKGLEGGEGWIELRLKLLADVGLVGLPNAGKSSLLSRMTRAAPKVASYPFTTLEPVLGTLEGPDRQLILADIPGLIEGASEGAGLGHEFLAHVERTRLLVHVLDLAPLDESDPEANFATIEHELELHDERLARLPRIVALSKADLVTDDEAATAKSAWEARLGADVPVFVTSSATRQGLDDLATELLRRVPVRAAAPQEDLEDVAELAEHRVFKPAARRGFRVARVEDGLFRVEGEAVDRLIARHDLDNEDALIHVEGRLRRMGVIRALEAAGFEPGDDVEIAGVVFELDPG